MKRITIARISGCGAAAFLAAWLLWGCSQKQDHSWKYYGEDTAAAPAKARQAGAYP